MNRLAQKVLLLNATYEVLGAMPWQRAVSMILTQKCQVVEQHQDAVIRSAGGFVMPLPAVIALTKMARVPRTAAVSLTRQRLKVRDKNVCQVKKCHAKGATIDHLLPRSRGGQHTWDNVVLMCAKHNSTKGDKLLSELGWKLKTLPRTPSKHEILSQMSASSSWGNWLAA